MAKKSQTQIILEELEANKERGITSWDMIVRHRITRLAAVICDLRKMGYTIESKIESNDDKRYSRYWLEEVPDEVQMP